MGISKHLAASCFGCLPLHRCCLRLLYVPLKKKKRTYSITSGERRWNLIRKHKGAVKKNAAASQLYSLEIYLWKSCGSYGNAPAKQNVLSSSPLWRTSYIELCCFYFTLNKEMPVVTFFETEEWFTPAGTWLAVQFEEGHQDLNPVAP